MTNEMKLPKKYAGATKAWELKLSRLAVDAPIFGFSILAAGKAAPLTSAGVYVNDTFIREGEGGYTPEEVEKNAVLLADSPRLAAAVVELMGALNKALEHGGGVEYNGQEDEIGGHVCCGGLSYEPHKADCWVTKAKEALASTAEFEA